MEILRETTEDLPKHDYAVEGTKALAYRKWSEGEWIVFKKPVSFDKRGRTFSTLKEKGPAAVADDSVITVQGSGGKTYTIRNGRCSCPGFGFRGTCKHVEANKG